MVTDCKEASSANPLPVRGRGHGSRGMKRARATAAQPGDSRQPVDKEDSKKYTVVNMDDEKYKRRKIGSSGCSGGWEVMCHLHGRQWCNVSRGGVRGAAKASATPPPPPPLPLPLPPPPSPPAGPARLPTSRLLRPGPPTCVPPTPATLRPLHHLHRSPPPSPPSQCKECKAAGKGGGAICDHGRQKAKVSRRGAAKIRPVPLPCHRSARRTTLCPHAGLPPRHLCPPTHRTIVPPPHRSACPSDPTAPVQAVQCSEDLSAQYSAALLHYLHVRSFACSRHARECK